MSQHDERRVERVTQELRRVEQFWHSNLPVSFRELYTHYTCPFVAPCEFFTLRAIVRGAGREFGMLPSFLPFGLDIDEGGIYGFYATEEPSDFWPVLYWEADEMFLRPVSSDFDAFLRRCVLVGRYQTEMQGPDDPADMDTEQDRRELARVLDLPEDLITGPVPGNDTMLYERLIASDPMDAVSLCHAGCARLAWGRRERALDYFHRACEAAPYFGDALYLVAYVHLEQEHYARAVQSWWGVVQRLLPLCTRTYAWDLGADHPEADIYEVAADGLSQLTEYATPEMLASPLWRVVTQEEPYDPDVREALGNTLIELGDLAGAEREYLNALSLCAADASRQPDRLYDALIALYERCARQRESALAQFDRTLPRPTV